MSFPVTGVVLLPLGILFGFFFGWLLQRGRVTDTNVIVNQFRLRDFTVAKVMLTAIVVGGIGIWLLHADSLAAYHIKPANLLGVGLGAVLFGIGMVVYGYCPGTGLAAIGTGSVHAFVGALGMLLGAILYALSFDWIRAHILPVGALGPVRLPELTGIPDIAWFGALAALAVASFAALEIADRRH
jgi:hypothetical protein